MDEKTILSTLKTDLAKITTTNGYSCSIQEIKHGGYGWDDFSIKPAIAFYGRQNEVLDHTMDDKIERVISILIAGFGFTEGYEDTANVYDIASDIENFLFSEDWTYTGMTFLVDRNVFPGGDGSAAAMCIIEVKIRYTQTIN